MSEEELKDKVKELADAKQKVEPVKTEETVAESLRLKQENDAYEVELVRKEELRARSMLDGRAEAGQPEKSDEDKANEEAANILKEFQ